MGTNLICTFSSLKKSRCMQDTFARATHSARPSARATIGYLVYKKSRETRSTAVCSRQTDFEASFAYFCHSLATSMCWYTLYTTIRARSARSPKAENRGIQWLDLIFESIPKYTYLLSNLTKFGLNWLKRRARVIEVFYIIKVSQKPIHFYFYWLIPLCSMKEIFNDILK